MGISILDEHRFSIDAKKAYFDVLVKGMCLFAGPSSITQMASAKAAGC